MKYVILKTFFALETQLWHTSWVLARLSEQLCSGDGTSGLLKWL